MHYAEPETKAKISNEQKIAGSPPPKKFQLSPCPGNVVLVAFWGKNSKKTEKKLRPRLAQKKCPSFA